MVRCLSDKCRHINQRNEENPILHNKFADNFLDLANVNDDDYG